LKTAGSMTSVMNAGSYPACLIGLVGP
jgi:hypothetical protein